MKSNTSGTCYREFNQEQTEFSLFPKALFKNSDIQERQLNALVDCHCWFPHDYILREDTTSLNNMTSSAC